MPLPSTDVLDRRPVRATPRELLADVLGWDVITWAAVLDQWQRQITVDLTRATALEIGAGDSGGLSLWLALQGCDVLCTTLGPVSDRVRARHRRYGVAHRVRYASLDALHLCERDAFDIIAFKSVLGGLGANGHAEGPRQAVARLHAALTPGGNLLFAENLAATRVHAALRARFGAGKDGWGYPTIGEMRRLLQRFACVRYRTMGFLGAWGLNETQRRMCGAADAFLCRWLIPSTWQYVIAGVAIKEGSRVGLHRSGLDRRLA